MRYALEAALPTSLMEIPEERQQLYTTLCHNVLDSAVARGYVVPDQPFYAMWFVKAEFAVATDRRSLTMVQPDQWWLQVIIEVEKGEVSD